MNRRRDETRNDSRSDKNRTRHRHETDPSDRTAPYKDASRGERLQRILADAGVASRRAAEQMIEEGRVSINGVRITALPAWADPVRDIVEVDHRPIARRQSNHRYLLLHKPRGVSCSSEPAPGRKTIADLVPRDQRLLCVGSLDHESTGLILLTDDGELANHLTHPRYQVPHSYLVSIKGDVTPDAIQQLRTGIYLIDRQGIATKARVDTLSVIDSDRQRTTLAITMTEGRNRQIRPMLAKVGLKVHRLQRTAIGPILLKGIPTGAYRELSRPELTQLREASAPKPRSAPPKPKPRAVSRPASLTTSTTTPATPAPSNPPAADRPAKPTGKLTGKPSGKFSGKPAGKFSSKPSGKPAGKSKPSSKPEAKSATKPTARASSSPAAPAPKPRRFSNPFSGKPPSTDRDSRRS